MDKDNDASIAYMTMQYAHMDSICGFVECAREDNSIVYGN